MTERSAEIRIEAAAITDRGLNARRPLNEDALLSNTERRIFAVADGVGGAEAGEVASQTAIEVLEEAFRQHREGDDAEDLMEIAIQRANASIFQQSRENPKYSMMATTIVALHLDGLRATIAHVGDSRLYRLTPDGSLQRETDDHSVVEEEVRAGRMTAAQAANHPSRNVISRALGAEASVEVDTKTVEFEHGTLFLLCSDGITRHISDEELSRILADAPSLDAACAELKRVCYERGAEDNLTAVIIRAGSDETAARPVTAEAAAAPDEEVTLVRERTSAFPAQEAAPHAAAEIAAGSLLQRPFSGTGTHVAAPLANGAAHDESSPDAAPSAEPSAPARGARRSSAGLVLGVLLLALAASALGFYGGTRYAERSRAEGSAAVASNRAAATAPAAGEGADSFERRRRAVDLSPAAEAGRLAAASNDQTAPGGDPETLYLYGRALLLTGRNEEAANAFERAIEQADQNMTARHGQLKIDARLASVAAHLRAGDVEGARRSAQALDEVVRAGSTNAPVEAAPGTQPSTGQTNAPAVPGVSPF